MTSNDIYDRGDKYALDATTRNFSGMALPEHARELILTHVRLAYITGFKEAFEQATEIATKLKLNGI